MEFSNTTLLYGLFNIYTFSEAKMNMKYLDMYYRDKHILQTNTLVSSLLELIRDYNYKDLTESRFMLTLQNDGRTVQEAEKIYSKIKEYRGYSKEQASVFCENLRAICAKAFTDRIQAKYGSNPLEYITRLKEFEYISNYSDILQAKTFKELDITDLVDRYSGEGYKSRYSFINASYSCGGYIPGQLVVVSAAPSVGKSLFLQSEAVNFIQQGRRVHYLVMGDLNEIDIAIRMMCQISHKSQRAIESDIIGNYELYSPLFSDKLSITCVPSGTVSARKYVDWMKQRLNDYDVLMVDYYSNFEDDESRSMYQHGGDICDALTELTRAGKLVFLAAQPKQSYYREEFLPYDALGESSRIGHVADMVITIGRRWEAGMRMGMFNIAKGRKCIADFNPVAYWIGTNEGLFYCCSDALYTKYRSNKSQRKLFSYDELTTMDILDNSIGDLMQPTLIPEQNETKVQNSIS